MSNAFADVQSMDGLELVTEGAHGEQVMPHTGALAELIKFVGCHVCGSTAFEGLYDATSQVYDDSYLSGLHVHGGDKNMLKLITNVADLNLAAAAITDRASCLTAVSETLTALDNDAGKSVFTRGAAVIASTGHFGFNFDKYDSLNNSISEITYGTTIVDVVNATFQNNVGIGSCQSYSQTDISDPANESELSYSLSGQLFHHFENGSCPSHADMENIDDGASAGMICYTPKSAPAFGPGNSQYINCLSTKADATQDDACMANLRTAGVTALNQLYTNADPTHSAIDAADVVNDKDANATGRMNYIVACLNAEDNQPGTPVQCIPEFVQSSADSKVRIVQTNQAGIPRAADDVLAKSTNPLEHQALKRYSFDLCMALENPDFTAAMGNNCL